MEFGPLGSNCQEEFIVLKIEEIESIRLMDLENLDQQACADQMNIGRTTFQRIYKEARNKIADSLVHGKRLIVENDEFNSTTNNGHCHRFRNK